MSLVDLPEELIIHIYGFLAPHTIELLGATCKQLYRISCLRVVWKNAYASSDLPLPPLRDASDEEDTTVNFKTSLIRAIRLEDNWTSVRPCPRSSRVHSSSVSSVWMLKSRYLAILGGGKLSYWDLDGEQERVWECPLRGVVTQAELLEIDEGSRKEPRFLFGYSSTIDPSSCQVLKSSETSTSPPQAVCNIEAHATVHAIGISRSLVVAVCIDGSIVTAGLEPPLQGDSFVMRREARLHARTVQQIVVLDKVILMIRALNRGVAIDVYELFDAPSTSTYVEARNSATVTIPQAQSIAISAGKPRPSTWDAESGETLQFHVFAALPYSIDHYRLLLHRSTEEFPVSLSLELLGDDQLSKRPSFGRVFAEPDGYDSDSRPSRIAQPSQVLDLQLGRQSRRAVAIQISAHSNDRLVWAYTLPKGKGPLISQRLAFNRGTKYRRHLHRQSDSLNSSPHDAEIITMLKSHACRTVFDEATGRVVVVADCEKFIDFQY